MSLQTGGDADLGLVNATGESPDIPNGSLFADFAEAVIIDRDALPAARHALLAELGSDAVVDAAGVAALFNAINRVADAIGIQVENSKLERTADFRETLGLDDYQTARFQQHD